MLLFCLIQLLIDVTLAVTCPTTSAIHVDETISRPPRQLDVQPMKILILTEPSPLAYQSGQSLRFMMLLHHLTNEYPSDKVQLITVDEVSPKPLPSTCCDGKVSVHYTSGWRLPQYRMMTLATAISTKVWMICRAEKPDILHVSSPGFHTVNAIIASRFFGIPLLISYHTHLPVIVRAYVPAPINRLAEWIVWKVLRFVHSKADLSVVTSPQIADEFAWHGIDNVRVWPKGVNTIRFHPRHKSSVMRNRMTDSHPQDLLLLYVGRLAKEKRLPDLKQILIELEKVEGCSVRLCIVGDGPESEKLRATFRDTPTVFLGRLEGESLSQAFSSADVFIMPSDSETLGFVTMESMASGVPVVACSAGGLIDVIDDQKTGYLVNVGHTEGYVKCIETLMNNATLRDEIVHRAREVMEGWSWFGSMEYLRQEAYPEAIHNYERRRGSFKPTGCV